ncbi:MAG: BTAD domain-containing putative transcriptional regulator [Anaerolineae bacterium]
MSETTGVDASPPAFGSDLVVRTRFIPPRPKPHYIPRPRLDALLTRLTNYPLTLLKAEAGYGKTTAIAAFLADSSLPYIWYNLSDTGVDPLTFLLHIIHALRAHHPAVGDQSLALLAQEGGATRLWAPAVDALANDLLDALATETVLVLDDYCQVNQAEINAITERLVEYVPPRLHIVLTTREMPSLPGRARWRAMGELLEIGRSELAFTAEEIGALFRQRTGHSLTPALARTLAAETEGWPIAVQLLSEGAARVQTPPLEDLLRRLPGPLEHLFDYLTQEVYAQQQPQVQTFLAETTILRRLDPHVCDYLFERNDSAETLRYLETHSLFIIGEGEYRYHSLFHDFLRRRTIVPDERRRALHRRAASYYQEQGEQEEAVYHLLNGGEYETAAAMLATIARSLAYNGRHQTLAGWLDQLPDDLLDAHPELLLARGHAYRFTSQYHESLAAYGRAQQRFEALGDASGEMRALRGQAQVYLDTVQPLRAEPLLRRALRRVDRGDRRGRASLLLLLAENKLNAGQLHRAERLHHDIYCAAQQEDFPPMNPRVFVRDGRFAHARKMVEASLRADPWGAGQWRAPRSHREATVLLAWIDAMTGEANSARHYAGQSLELGRILASPIVECVSLSRLGHGWLSGPDFDPEMARAYYQESLAIAEKIGVPRFQVEAHLGLTLIAGLGGKVAEAMASAQKALAILEETGDSYMIGILTLALGAAMTLCHHPGAETRLTEAARQGQICGDRFSPCVADLWLAIHYSYLGQGSLATAAFERALSAAQLHGYDFLFTGMPLLGPKDLAPRLMLLNQVAPATAVSQYAARLRHAISPQTAPASHFTSLATNPVAAPLYIQTLGPFRVRQAGREIERSAWGRAKALHLLQYLVCRRGHLAHREKILEALWPDTPPTTAATGLRVALSVLRKALAPDPGGGEAPDFIRRDGESLQLDLSLGIHTDADEFMGLIRSAQAVENKNPAQAIELYESALALYRGDFLEENPYAEWVREERERLLAAYLSAAERVAKLLVGQDECERGMRWANAILAKDPLWEEGYALLMQCHWKLGNRALAVRVYDRCRRRLREELAIEPSPRTTALFEEISQM